MTDSEINRRISNFKTELRALEPLQIIRKYITFGEAFILDSNTHFKLRSEIAEHFNIHPSEVIMVGSGKLGFSIKPKKMFVPFGELSDIDMAVISPTLFDQVWRQTLDYASNGYEWLEQDAVKFKDYFFKGWIRPDALPRTNQFRETQDWWEFFRSLTNSYRTYKISGGLYKSWYHFEMYQSIAVNKCRYALETDK